MFKGLNSRSDIFVIYLGVGIGKRDTSELTCFGSRKRTGSNFLLRMSWDALSLAYTSFSVGLVFGCKVLSST